MPKHRPLATNGFCVDLPAALDVLVRDFADPRDVAAERERLAGGWIVHWEDGQLFCVRRTDGGPHVEGVARKLSVADRPRLFRSLLDDTMGAVFSQYRPIRQRPFTFLARKAEVMGPAAVAARVAHPLLSGFKVTPRFSVGAKLYEPASGSVAVGIFIGVGMHHDIDASLADLTSAGVDLSGCLVVRRSPAEGQRRFLGRIERLSDAEVLVIENGETSDFPLADVKLEATKENLVRCLTVLLGASRYRALTTALDDEQAAYLKGVELDDIVGRMGDHLAKRPIAIAHGVHASVGDRIILRNGEAHRSIYSAPSVDYVFDRTGAKSDAFAWPGLTRFGPYDRATFTGKSPRLLVVFPTPVQGKVETFLHAFRNGLGANFRGFQSGFRDLFGLVKVDFLMCPAEVSVGDKRGAEAAYRAAIEARLASEGDVQGCIVVLFDEHAFLPGLSNPYIRTKALLLTLGIPTQEVRMATVVQPPPQLQYSLQNFAVSMYAKLNGTPWTVNQDKAISDEIVIGVGFAELSGSRLAKRQRFVGITTVFGGDGTYVLGNVSKDCDYDGYGAMLRESMLAILRELKTRNNWRPGDTIRVIYHAHRPLKRVDVAEILFACARAVGSEQDVQMAFLTVGHEHPFLLFDRGECGEPIRRGSDEMKGVFAPARGTIATIGRNSRLLAVNSGRLIKRRNTPLPTPLLVSLHGDSTFRDVDYLTEQVLKFTALSWRSTLPVGTPATIFYGERIAELLGRLREVPDFSTAALSVKLKWSRWFL